MIFNKQLPFDFDHRPSLGGDDFLVAPSNQEAVSWIDRWPNWPTPFLILCGPPGCGKTHLCNVFMAITGARLLSPEIVKINALTDLLMSNENFVVDNSNLNRFQDFSEELLFHFYNELSLRGGHMLITSKSNPIDWRFGLADLSSRIKSAQMVVIGDPEDDLIRAVLVKLFSDQQVRVEIDVIDYIVTRMERSLESARNFAEAANELALSQKRGITLALARQVFEELKL